MDKWKSCGDADCIAPMFKVTENNCPCKEDAKRGMCPGTHGGKNNACKSCYWNIENHPEDSVFDIDKHFKVDPILCTIAEPYWSQYVCVEMERN